MAYLQWIHSTRSQQLFWRKGCGVLHFPQRWRRGPTAAGCQNAEMLIWSLAPSWDSAWWMCPLVTGRLCSFKVLGDCYRYSSSKAWCRAMRSEWLETLQKGMACCGGADNVVRMGNVPSTSPERLLCQSTPLPNPLYSELWTLPIKISTSHLFKTKSKLTPPLRMPECILKCNSGVCFFLRRWWVFLKQTYTAAWVLIPNFK